jgi:hypothetical protein
MLSADATRHDEPFDRYATKRVALMSLYLFDFT